MTFYRLTIRLKEEEYQVILNVKDAMGFTTVSDAVRNILRLVKVLFDTDLTFEKAVKPHVLKLILTNESFRKEVPFCEILKPVPELEKILGTRSHTSLSQSLRKRDRP